MTPTIDDNKKRLSKLMTASPLLLAAACLLPAFAARAAPANHAPAAATSAASDDANSDEEIDEAQAATSTQAAPPAQPQPMLGKFRSATLNIDDNLQVQADGDDEMPPGPPPPPPPRWRPRRRPPPPQQRREARTGALFGFGLGGAQTYLSGADHQGALDGNLRLGYGFSDRLQMWLDLGRTTGVPADDGPYFSQWHFRLHGQTVLFGDRRGNGLNLNLGIGFGGVDTYGYSVYHDSSQVGLSVGGGLSFEARVSPHFALAPELFMAWQQVPNYNDLPSDIAWSYGVRLNFVWYSWF